MTKPPLCALIISCACLLCLPWVTRANDYKKTACAGSYARGFLSLPAVMDTVPGNKQSAGNATTEKKDDLIKEVPKAKKQDKPIAVIPVTVKPVLVKPKVIIKPIIKIH